MNFLSFYIVILLSATSYSAFNPNLTLFEINYTEPECIAVLNRNISKAVAGIEKLKATKESNTPESVFQRDMMRFKSTIAGLDRSVINCKTSNTEYDFSNIDKQISKIKFDFNELGLNSKKETNKLKKTWMDVNKYGVYIRSFPTSHPPKLNMEANWIFTREEVTFYLSDQSEDATLKSSLTKFISNLNSDATKNAFLSTVNDMKGQVNKEEAVKELNFLIRDLNHLSTVFAPETQPFSAVIDAAIKMKAALK